MAKKIGKSTPVSSPNEFPFLSLESRQFVSDMSAKERNEVLARLNCSTRESVPVILSKLSIAAGQKSTAIENYISELTKKSGVSKEQIETTLTVEWIISTNKVLLVLGVRQH